MISWEVWCWTLPGLTPACFHHSINKPNLCSSETWNCKKGKRQVSFQIIIAWTAVDCGKEDNHYWEAQGFSKCGPWTHAILGHVCHQFAHERSTEMETLGTSVAIWQNSFILVEFNIYPSPSLMETPLLLVHWCLGDTMGLGEDKWGCLESCVLLRGYPTTEAVCCIFNAGIFENSSSHFYP